MEIQNKLLLIGLFLLACFLRFYNLNWGAPYYFHPDERNIASSVTQLSFPQNLHPHFFAYGSFPLYSIYAGSLFWERLTNTETLQSMTVRFETAIQVSRFYSALFSLLLPLLLYKVAKRIAGDYAGLLVFSLAALSLGFIQYAHFGTFEMWLSFFMTLLLYLLLVYLQTKKLRFLAIAAVITGLLISIKVSSLPLIAFPLLLLAKHSVQTLRHYHLKTIMKKILSFILLSVLLLGIMLLTVLSTSPFTFLDFPAFKSAIDYESAVALGTIRVFYTESFQGTIPVLYQFTHIFPFLIGPLPTILFIPSFCIVLLLWVKKHKSSYALLLMFFVILFLSQAPLFAKWTRYMVPTMPFMYLIISVALSYFVTVVHSMKSTPAKPYATVAVLEIIALLVFSTSIQGLAFFATVHLRSDTRVQAAEFAGKHIHKDASVLSEVFDMGIVPFNDYLSHITLFNFYDLDFNPEEHAPKLDATKTSYEYIILPSQRLYKTRLTHPKEFPRGHAFYTNLFSGNEYTIIYETPCDSLCQITYLGNPKYTLEDTSNVFDRPPVIIVKNKRE